MQQNMRIQWPLYKWNKRRPYVVPIPWKIKVWYDLQLTTTILKIKQNELKMTMNMKQDSLLNPAIQFRTQNQLNLVCIHDKWNQIRYLVYLTRCLYIPSGVSTSTALYSSAGVAATWMASICSKLPKGWHLGISSEIGRWCRVPVIRRMMLSIM